MGTKTATSTTSGTTSGTSQSALAQPVRTAYDQLLSQLGGMANTANNNAVVNSASTGLGNLASSSNPNFATAASTLSSAAAPTYSTVGNYMSPYLQQVMQANIASQNEQNAEQQQGVIGNAIAKGAFGGNRVGVAQGELARQQDIVNQATNAGLLNSGYQQALQAAQTGQQNATNIGTAQANLGSSQTAANLSTLLGQLGAGEFQQTTPYSNFGSLAGAANALSNYGQTTTAAGESNGSSTQPTGNLFSSLLGAGLSVAALWPKASGGRVKGFAAGGSADDLMAAIEGARAAAQSASMLGSNANDNQANDNFGLGPIGSGMLAEQKKGLSNILSLFRRPQADPIGPGVSSFGDIAAAGFGSGGAVARRAYAPGGMIESPYPDFFSGSALYSDAAPSPTIDDVSTTPTARPDDVAFVPPDPVADPVVTDSAPRGLAPPSAAMIPPTQGSVVDNMGTARIQAPAISGVNAPIGYGIPDSNAGYATNLGDVINSVKAGKGLNLSPDTRMALLSAGLGIMGSTSPNALTNIGKGAQAGLKTWMDKQALNRENALAQSQIGLEQGNLGLEGQRTQQAAQGLYLNAQQTAGQLAELYAQANRLNVAAGTERWQVAFSPYGPVLLDKLNPMAGANVLPYNVSGQTNQPAPTISGGVEAPGSASTPSTGPASTSGTPANAANASAAAPSPGMDDHGFVTQAPDNAPINPMMMTDAGYTQLLGEGKPIIDSARQQATTAQSANVQLEQLRSLSDALPDSGPLTQGHGFEDRLGIMKGLNTAAQMFGFKPFVTEDQMGTAEDILKAARTLQFNVANGVNADPAVATIATAAQASPSGENTKQGIRTIVGNLEAINKRSLDRAQYLASWQASHRGDMTGAPEAFDAANPPVKYIEFGKILGGQLPDAVTTKKQYDALPDGTYYSSNGKVYIKGR
jgi:hypothetical protein